MIHTTIRDKGNGLDTYLEEIRC